MQSMSPADDAVAAGIEQCVVYNDLQCVPCVGAQSWGFCVVAAVVTDVTASQCHR